MWGSIVLLLLILVLLALIPVWPYSRRFSYWPGGVVAALLVAWLGLIWLGYVVPWTPWDPAPPVIVEEPGD